MTPAQVFSYKYYEIFKKSFFMEYLRWQLLNIFAKIVHGFQMCDEVLYMTLILLFRLQVEMHWGDVSQYSEVLRVNSISPFENGDITTSFLQ